MCKTISQHTKTMGFYTTCIYDETVFFDKNYDGKPIDLLLWGILQIRQMEDVQEFTHEIEIKYDCQFSMILSGYREEKISQTIENLKMSELDTYDYKELFRLLKDKCEDLGNFEIFIFNAEDRVIPYPIAFQVKNLNLNNKDKQEQLDFLIALGLIESIEEAQQFASILTEKVQHTASVISLEEAKLIRQRELRSLSVEFRNIKNKTMFKNILCCLTHILKNFGFYLISKKKEPASFDAQQCLIYLHGYDGDLYAHYHYLMLDLVKNVSDGMLLLGALFESGGYNFQTLPMAERH